MSDPSLSTELLPALAAISHGTSNPSGQAVVRRLVDDVATAARDQRLGAEVRLGHVDVQDPDVPATLADLPAQLPAVVVPVLLSAGYHVNVDLKKETADVGREVTIAGALGPDDRLVELLVRRLEEAGADPERDTIILGVAGSSDAAAVEDCHEMGRRLAVRLDAEVEVAFLAAAKPTVAEAVAGARQHADGAGEGRVVVVSYLLAPGYFQDLLEKAQADFTTAPLLPAPEDIEHPSASPSELVDIILDRYRGR
ncbi:sirohydrochlorin chelatase [Nesterenkonia xinjiangensis]|uniref:Sirohydrochlorin ferrochelatase n=1 Tax=Nesterenkonia xinjiangensis TaxID=225327 RepID=A0A7Z0GK52_9MICC|nr:CbiX/SirB N-terminal domain-containing protein [Nesterenkonia xinjiangensis]NYJ77455.1 sirohydrochlorin ferrochelatase [Nesterenkonia xinjiangensis]